MTMILLCSDLDRTLLPNGAQAESPPARPILRRIVDRDDLRLAYVSGRDRRLIQEAVAEYELPLPDFAIGDVGTTLYRVTASGWDLNKTWLNAIANDWGDYDHGGLAALLAGDFGDAIQLQPEAAQNRYKVSYFTPADIDAPRLRRQIDAALVQRGVEASIVWSLDEATGRGLLDILPRRANKLQAIRFLMQQEGIDDGQVVFAGDSGNDLDVLTSGMPAILVGNAAPDVRREALARLAEQGLSGTLYLATGDFFGMNGNYAAGVLEGLAHFFPPVRDWIAAAS
jgi:hydroxymethylpyrimidine pyrophosphatase-like HAD family hydrolase